MNKVALGFISGLISSFSGMAVCMLGTAIANKVKHHEFKIVTKSRPVLAKYGTSDAVQLELSEPICIADIYGKPNISEGTLAEEIEKLQEEMHYIEFRHLDERLEGICIQLEPINSRTTLKLCELCVEIINEAMNKKEECENEYKQNELSWDEIIDLGNKVMDVYGVLSKSKNIISTMGQEDVIFIDNDREVFNSLCDMQKSIRKNAIDIIKEVWEQNKSDNDKISDCIEKMDAVFLLMRPLDTENIDDKDESYSLLFRMFEEAAEIEVKICEDLLEPFVLDEEGKIDKLGLQQNSDRIKMCENRIVNICNLWDTVYKVNIATGRLNDLEIKSDIILNLNKLVEKFNYISYTLCNSYDQSKENIKIVEIPGMPDNDVSPISKESSSSGEKKKLIFPLSPMSPTFRRFYTSPTSRRVLDFNGPDDMPNEKQEKILPGDDSSINSSDWDEMSRKLDEGLQELEACSRELDLSPSDKAMAFDDSIAVTEEKSTDYSDGESEFIQICKNVEEKAEEVECNLNELTRYYKKKANNSFDDLKNIPEGNSYINRENSNDSSLSSLSWDMSGELNEIEKKIEETKKMQEELDRDTGKFLEFRYEFSEEEEEEDRATVLNRLDEKRRRTAEVRKKNNRLRAENQENLENAQGKSKTIKKRFVIR